MLLLSSVTCDKADKHVKVRTLVGGAGARLTCDEYRSELIIQQLTDFCNCM